MSDLEHTRDELDQTQLKRARHVVTEIARTEAAAIAFENNDWKHAGELMYASHESLRDDFEVSCPELDLLVELARSIGPGGGVFGSRMTGGGFGGSTVTLLKTWCVDEVTNAIAEEYSSRFGHRPDFFTSRPAHGAQVIRYPADESRSK